MHSNTRIKYCKRFVLKQRDRNNRNKKNRLSNKDVEIFDMLQIFMTYGIEFPKRQKLTQKPHKPLSEAIIRLVLHNHADDIIMH